MFSHGSGTLHASSFAYSAPRFAPAWPPDPAVPLAPPRPAPPPPLDPPEIEPPGDVPDPPSFERLSFDAPQPKRANAIASIANLGGAERTPSFTSKNLAIKRWTLRDAQR
jgi:hypothetical protein